MKRLNRIPGILAAVAAAAVCSAPALAAVPLVTAVEGTLYSAGGGAAADGNYQVTFAVYKDEVGGNPLWFEGPVTVSVKNGQWQHLLGAKTPLSPVALNGAGLWLGMQIASDPELARKPLASSAFAVRAAVADGVECSGCIGQNQIDAKFLAGYAKAADLKPVALSGKFSDLEGGPDLSAYVKAAALSKVATGGNYTDLNGLPDLTAYAKATDLQGYAKVASLAAVAGTGSWNDLKDKPVLTKKGDKCQGTGMVMVGIKADGSYECTASAVGPDMIDEISNNLIFNQFVDSQAGTPNVIIPDGSGAGVNDKLTFPDIGLAQAVWINIDLANSDVSKIKIELYGPNMPTPYILYDGSKTGKTLKTAFNKDTAIVQGDINKDWVGKNIAGNWSITVRDPNDNVTGNDDGKFSWDVTIQTLSSKKVQIKGNLIVNGDITVAGAINNQSYNMVFPPGSRPFLYGINVDRCEGNWNYNPQYSYPHDVPIDNKALHAVAQHIVWGDVAGNIHFGQGGDNYGNGNNDYTRQFLVAFVKNTTAADITKQICFRTSSNPWGNGNYRGISVNKANTWSTTGNDLSGGDCPNVTFPKNQSSVVVLKAGTYMWTTWNGYWNKTIIGYYNDSWNLPNGLEWDYARYYEWLQNK